MIEEENPLSVLERLIRWGKETEFATMNRLREEGGYTHSIAYYKGKISAYQTVIDLIKWYGIDINTLGVKEYVEHPFFEFYKEMIDIYNYHFAIKGDTYKDCTEVYLLDKLSSQFEDMNNDPERENYMVNIANYSCMIRLNEKRRMDK